MRTLVPLTTLYPLHLSLFTAVMRDSVEGTHFSSLFTSLVSDTQGTIVEVVDLLRYLLLLPAACPKV